VVMARTGRDKIEFQINDTNFGFIRHLLVPATFQQSWHHYSIHVWRLPSG
jgi:hypothetical protein